MPAAPDFTPDSTANRSGFIVLTGNPNCGKTTLFNALTGLRAKVGNYAGVTVERKEGRLLGVNSPRALTVLDLPGTYSLSPKSLDEQIARDVLLHRLAEVPAPELVVVVVDASNLQRNLYYATQVIELGYPTLVALNMVDVAQENGHDVNAERLAEILGVPVIATVGNAGQGMDDLRREIMASLGRGGFSKARASFCDWSVALEREISDLADLVGRTHPGPPARIEALLLLTDEHALDAQSPHHRDAVRATVAAGRARLEAAGVDWRGAAIEARYARVAEITAEVVAERFADRETASDRLDRVLTHKVWGLLIFVGLMALMFQSIFTFAKIPMDWISTGVEWIGAHVGAAMPPGTLQSLVENGVIKGVGAVVVFLPQICLLFLFIGLLEDTGYMARAAFLMDRLMSRVGLHGKSFIPMLSSFACAIPGIMATRTIETPKDRLVTILVAPLMSCSARLPVYTLLIAACIPASHTWFFGLQGLTMLFMYLLGIVIALAMAWLLKKTLLKGATPMLIMELPPYKRPVLRVVLRHMWDRSKLFLRRAGTVILGINIILWFLATYPKDAKIDEAFDAQRAAVFKGPGVSDAAAAGPAITKLREKFSKPQATTNATEAALVDKLDSLDKEESGAKLRHSFAGRLGRAIEPAIAPLGFDWKIGIGIVASFAAREVFVSTMSTVYNVGRPNDPSEAAQTLAQTLREQKRENGKPLYTTLLGITLMVFYVLALQCVSTVAVVRRETNSWKWPVFQWLYMGALAWGLAFVTYQGGRLLGFE
ncbi:MAG: ferrous iron transport protein B [Verrucomicrobia bacterium]|nr:ferrous iron transport protein B [Verrucomicrobiota bacterium]